MRSVILVASALFLVGSVGVVAPKSALAQSPTSQNSTKARTEKMLGLIRQANVLYDEKDWAGALKLYKDAYEVQAEPQLLWRLGLTSERSGDIRGAIRYYDLLVVKLPNEKVATKAKANAKRLRDTLAPTIRVSSTPSGANLYLESLESSPVGSTPYTIETTKGEHVIVLKLDGYQTVRKSLALENGDQKTLNVELEPLAFSGDQRQVIIDDVSATDDSFNASLWGGVTLGLGAATLLTAGAFSFLQADATDQANSFDKAGASSPGQGRREIAQLQEDAESYHSTAQVLYISGGVITAGGLGLLMYGLFSSGEEKETESVSFGISFDGTIGVRHRF